MNFWESELGEVTGKASDAFAKSFTLIPDGTTAIAKIESFTNVEYEGNKFLLIVWRLKEGDFTGQKVEQKLKVWGDPRDKDPAKTRHRALNMLKLIYQLYKIQPKHNNPPTDADLSVFVGKSAGILIRETEPNASGKQYNWVAEIHDSKGFESLTGITTIKTFKAPSQDNESAFDRERARRDQFPADALLTPSPTDAPW